MMEIREGKLLVEPGKMTNLHAIDAVAECAELWVQANQGKRISDPCEGAVSQVIGRHIDKAVDELRADRDRLQAIVDKLPKTADGVPTVPGMVLYSIRLRASDLGPMSWTVPSPCSGEGCYSTRKAAEAAAKEIKP